MSRNKDLPKLLRAVAAGTDAKNGRQDVIFNAAADEIERLRERIKSARELVEEYDRVGSIDHVAAKAILWRLTYEQELHDGKERT
jgi:hypothetical protein